MIRFNADPSYELLRSACIELAYAGSITNDEDVQVLRTISDWFFIGLNKLDDAVLQPLWPRQFTERARILRHLENLNERQCSRFSGISPHLLDMLYKERTEQVDRRIVKYLVSSHIAPFYLQMREMAQSVLEEKSKTKIDHHKIERAMDAPDLSDVRIHELDASQVSQRFVAYLMLQFAESNRVNLQEVVRQ